VIVVSSAAQPSPLASLQAPLQERLPVAIGYLANDEGFVAGAQAIATRVRFRKRDKRPSSQAHDRSRPEPAPARRDE
jgi:hypothetical protein